MWYWLIGFLLVVTAILLLRIRVRCDFDDTRRLLFVGLGRTGPEFDFTRRVIVFRLAGFHLGSRPMLRLSMQPDSESTSSPKKRSRLSIDRLVLLIERSGPPLWQFGSGLVRGVTIEEGWAEIRGGFESPDLTGMSLGYYYSLVGAVPGFQRISFIPDWLGPSFAARGRLSLALPLYVLIWRLLVLLLRLPKRELIRAIR